MTQIEGYKSVCNDTAGLSSPDFGRSVNPISTKVSRLCLPNNTGTPGFSDLPTALHYDLGIFLRCTTVNLVLDMLF